MCCCQLYTPRHECIKVLLPCAVQSSKNIQILGGGEDDDTMWYLGFPKVGSEKKIVLPMMQSPSRSSRPDPPPPPQPPQPPPQSQPSTSSSANAADSCLATLFANALLSARNLSAQPSTAMSSYQISSNKKYDKLKQPFVVSTTTSSTLDFEELPSSKSKSDADIDIAEDEEYLPDEEEVLETTENNEEIVEYDKEQE